MSILSSLLRDVAALFFPPRCPVCGRMLAQGEHTVCTLCRATAPLTGFWRQADNPVLGRCRDMLPVERASGLLYYVHGSGWRELIRGFKYRGAWRTARAMGEWYGRCLKESGLYDDVEVVVPLPLHPVKRCRRGQHDAFVRRGDSALGARVPHQHRRARRLAARSGREGVGCGNYFSTGRTFPQGRCRAETMLKHSFRQNIPRRGFEFSRLIATFGL